MDQIDQNASKNTSSDTSRTPVGFLVSLCKEHHWMRIIVKLLVNPLAAFIVLPILALCYVCKSVLQQLMIWNKIDNLPNRHVIITGCGSGFGRETAVKLAKMGLQVHAGVRRELSMEELRTEYRGTNLHIDLCDVGSDASVRRYGEILKRRLGSDNIWAVINNAGVQSAFIDEDFIDLDVYQSTMNVNFYGSVRMVNVCQPLMSREKGGRLIFVLSVSSYYPVPYCAAYVASKSALLGYVNALRLEHVESNITIHSCVSGFFPTKLIHEDHLRSFDTQLEKLTPQQRQMYTTDVITKRIESNSLQIELLIQDNTVAMIADSLTNVVVAKWPTADFWMGWDWLAAKAMSIMPTENLIWYLTFWMRNSGSVSLTRIIQLNKESNTDNK